MPTTTKTAETAEPTSPREHALADVAHWSSQAADSTAKIRAARVELEQLDRESLQPVANDDVDLDRIAKRIPELKTLITLCEARAGEARRRETTARRAALAAEADEVDAPISAARAEIEAHQTRVAELKQALEAAAEAPFRLLTFDEQRWAATGSLDVRFNYTPSREERLCAALEPLERTRAMLRAGAAGDDVRAAFPKVAWQDYPPSMREGGVLPTPGMSAPGPAVDYAAMADDAARALKEQEVFVERLSADPTNFDMERVLVEKGKLDALAGKVHTYRGWAQTRAAAHQSGQTWPPPLGADWFVQKPS